MKRFRNKRTAFLFGIIIQVFILLICLFSYKNETEVIDIKSSEWESEFIQYKDNEWYVDSSYEITVDDPKVLIHKSNLQFEQGTYSIIIEYIADENQECTFIYDPANADNNYIKGLKGILSKNKTSVIHNFEVSEDAKYLDFAIMYNGKGNFAIKDITFIKNSRSSIYLIRNLLILLAAIDAVWVFYMLNKKNKKIVLSLFLISIVASLPLFITGDTGDDLLFHLVRIEGIFQEIKNRQIPVYLSSLWIDGYGYPVSIYYGDLFLYFPVFLRFLGFSITIAYKIFVYFVNLGTAVISYFSFKKIFKNDKIGILISFAYTTAAYRLANIYVRAAVGEFCAMMFMPIIALAVYNIYLNNTDDWKEYRKNALLLAFGMSGLIQSHILSTELCVFALFIICLVMLKKTLRINTLRVFITAVIESIFLNLYFLVPFVDSMINERLEINLNMLGKSAIQSTGLNISHLFSFFNINGNYRALNPGLVLMSGLIIAVIYLFYRKKDNQLIFYVSASLITLLLSSSLFPWNHLSIISRLINYLGSIQFAWRFLGLSIVFLSLVLGRFLEIYFENRGEIKQASLLITIVSCIMCSYYSSSHLQFAKLREFYDCSSLDTVHTIGFGEYLLPNANLEAINGQIEYENVSYLEILDKRGTMYELWVDVGENAATVKIPLFNYRNYQVSDSYGNLYPVFSNDYGEICFKLPPHFEGIVTVNYVIPKLWKISELISAFTLGLVIVNLLLKKYKKESCL